MNHKIQQVMICMEVLDNLPHDKVMYRDGKLHEVWAVKKGDGDGAHNKWSEELREVSDPILKRAIDLWCVPLYPSHDTVPWSQTLNPTPLPKIHQARTPDSNLSTLRNSPPPPLPSKTI